MTDQQQYQREVQLKNLKMSRIFFFLCVASTAISLSACGNHESPPSSGEMSSAKQQAADQALANNINAGNAWLEEHYGAKAKGPKKNVSATNNSGANGTAAVSGNN